MWATEKSILSALTSPQGKGTPSMKVIPGKPQLTLPVTSYLELLNSELLGPSRGRDGQLGALVGNEWGVCEARKIG